MSEQLEFLKHLRAVSLTIVLGSAGLLLASALPRSNVTENAYLSATAIRDAAPKMTEEWYRGVLKPLGWVSWGYVLDPEDTRQSRSFGIIIKAGDERHEASIAVLDDSDELAYLVKPFPILEKTSSAQHPQTLSEFRASWDALHARSITQRTFTPRWSTADVMVDPDANFGFKPVIIGGIPSRGVAEGYGTISSFLDVGSEEQWVMRVWSRAYYQSLSKKWGPYDVSYGDERPREIRFPIVGESQSRRLRVTSILVSLAKAQPIDLQESFSRAIGKSWRSLRFDEAFRELAQEAKGLETITLEQLETYLGTKRTQAGEKVEVLGLKIPSAAIGTWGILVLLGVQAYALLHFRQYLSLYAKVEPPPFPWIGLYRDPSSRGLFLASVAILPAFSSLFLALRSEPSSGREKLLILALASGNSALAIATTFLHARNWRRVANADLQSQPEGVVEFSEKENPPDLDESHRGQGTDIINR